MARPEIGPSQDWLKLAQTSQAKNKIRAYFKKQKRDENIVKGRELVDKEIRLMEFDVKEILVTDNLKRVAGKFNFVHEDDMFAAVGYNGITALQVANRLTEKWRKKRDVEQVSDISNAVAELKSFPTRKKRESGVRVEGIENLLIRLITLL